MKKASSSAVAAASRPDKLILVLTGLCLWTLLFLKLFSCRPISVFDGCD